MAYLAKGLKEDLKILASELGIDTQPNYKIIDFKKAILESEDYNEEFCKEMLNTIINMRKDAIEEQRRKEEIEEQRRRDAIEEQRRRGEIEFELEKLKIEANSRQNGRLQVQSSRTPSEEFKHLIQKFDMKEDISLYLVLFERQARRVSLPQEEWVTHLSGLLPYEINQLIAREPEEKVEDYDYVKELLLKRFKLTPEKFRQLFASHQKAQASTWRDFYHELCTYFDGWISALKITTFEKLRDLIIADQIKKRAPVDFREYYLDEWSNIISPVELSEKLDDYDSVKKPVKTAYNIDRERSKFSKPPFLNFREKFNSNRDVSNKIPIKGISGNRQTEKFEKQSSVKCYECGDSGHLRAYCPKLTKNHKYPTSVNKASEKEKASDAYIARTCNGVVTCDSEKGQTKKMKLSNLIVVALVDTGSSVCLLREDLYEKVNGSPKLTNKPLLLSGIGASHVWTKGSFQQEVEIDEYHFLLTWHVVPALQLSFEAVIGADILDQASLNFTQKGVEFCKYEAKTWLMQISELSQKDEIELSHIHDKQLRAKLEEIVSTYKPEKTETTDVSMKIILNDDTPIYQRARRLSVPERQEVNRQIQEWLQQGIIRPSSSDYASPVVLVKKKDNTTRLCVDYRKLNRKLVKDRFPLPLIEDVLDRLQDDKVYTTLDLKNGFFHVSVDENSQKYTSFIVPDGQFEFTKVPFGLSTSPSVFQRYVYSVFRDLMNKGIVIIYMDDLIIPSVDEKEGIEKLETVLAVASKYGLEIKMKKCQFLKRKVEFLGHILENGTIRPSPAKTLAVKKFPVPTNVKQVQSFLGMTGYFRKFISGYSKIAKPLSDLLKKNNSFVFGPEQEKAFEKLKNLLTESPVLSIFKQQRKTELHTDASKQGYGAILLQEADDGKLHPVYYMSKKTSPAEEKYSSYELEVLAIVEALKKFRVYLLGNQFKIVTDCSAFQKTMDKKDLVTRIARWALLLEEFDYEIVHRPGQRMQHVDALSRYPVMIIRNDTLTAKLKNAQLEDEHICALKALLPDNESNEYFVRNGILYKFADGRELIVVPRDMQTELIKLVHEKGHFSTTKTEEVVKQEFFIPNLNKLTQKVITNCVPCILANRKSGKKEGFLNPIPKEDVPLGTYHVDFIGPLPSTNKKYQHILTIVDAFTKFVWLYPVKSVSAEDALEKLKLQQKTFGNPSRIITDRGAAFTSKAFSDYCLEEGIQHVQIATGVPRGNGQVERIHRTLIPILTKLTLDDATKWFKHVDKLQRVLNSTTSRSTKWTPFELLTGVKMKNKDDITLRNLLVDEMIDEFQDRRNFFRQEAKKNIQKIQTENKKTYNKKRKKAPEYQVGDLVAIQKTQFGTGLKLRPKFLGPYKVTKVNPKDRYEVEKVGDHSGPITTTTSADLMKYFSKM